jgi:hypothetical protein
MVQTHLILEKNISTGGSGGGAGMNIATSGGSGTANQGFDGGLCPNAGVTVLVVEEVQVQNGQNAST